MSQISVREKVTLLYVNMEKAVSRPADSAGGGGGEIIGGEYFVETVCVRCQEEGREVGGTKSTHKADPGKSSHAHAESKECTQLR